MHAIILHRIDAIVGSLKAPQILKEKKLEKKKSEIERQRENTPRTLKIVICMIEMIFC